MIATSVKLKYLGCVLDQLGTDVSECCRKVVNGGGLCCRYYQILN